jgi:peptidyl-prolyl cis-trans isomerase D
MLQEIREKAQGWVAWAIVILISVPFALWGIQSYLGVGGESVVAKVDGTEITERQFEQNVQRTRIQLRERLGASYDPEVFGGQRLRRQVLDGMVRDLVLLQTSADMGLHVADQDLRAAILSEPAFQRDGRFDKATYERVLELQGLTPAAYEDDLRRRLLSSQLQRAVFATAIATDSEVDRLATLSGQKREVAYVHLPGDAFRSDEQPTDAAIQAFYDEHQDRFMTPEQVRLEYLLLDAKALAGDEPVDEAALREAYEARLDDFREPERRQVRHILLAVPMDADDALAEDAKVRLNGIRDRILAGESFSAIAEETSEDPVSAAAGGDLGFVERGLMDPAFEQAAFELEEGVVSEPVRSRFGYHLIEVTGIEGGEPQPFEDVRDQLAAELSSGGVEGAYFDLAERLANLTFENPDSLVPAAEELGLTLETTDWIDREGTDEGLFRSQRLIGAAFSEDVLVMGNNSEVIEPEPDSLRAVVVRVAEHRESRAQPLDEVRDEIVDLLQARAASEAAATAAEQMAARINGGASVEAVADGHPVEQPGLVERNDPNLPAAARGLAFRLPRPDGDGVSAGSVPDDAGGAFVVVVNAVEDGDPSALPEPQRVAESRSLTSTWARSGYEHLVDDFEARADIERELPPSDEEGG